MTKLELKYLDLLSSTTAIISDQIKTNEELRSFMARLVRETRDYQDKPEEKAVLVLAALGAAALLNTGGIGK